MRDNEMYLISRERGTVPVCGYCHTAQAGGHFTRPRKRNWLCDKCFRAVATDTITRYCALRESGYPDKRMYFEYPVNFLPFMDEAWIETVTKATGRNPFDEKGELQTKSKASRDYMKWLRSQAADFFAERDRRLGIA